MKSGRRVLEVVREKYPTEDIYEICKREGITIVRKEMEKDRLGFYLPFDKLCRLIIVQAGLAPEIEQEVLAYELYYHFAEVKSDRDELEKRKLLKVFPYLMGQWQAHSFASLLLCPDVSRCRSVHEIMTEYNCSERVAEQRWKVEEESMKYGGS